MADMPVLKQIPVNRILPSRHQARKNFDEEGLKGLAASIQKEGLLEPVMVRAIPAPQGTDGEWYELVYGERRWRACKLLGLDSMDVIVMAVPSEAAAAAKGLVENLQREGINPIEEAEGFVHLNQLDPGYWTYDQISTVAGKDRTYISRSIGLLQLPDSIKDDVRYRTIHRSHAVELMRLTTAELQEKAAKEIIAKDLNLESTRLLISKMIENTGNSVKTQAGDVTKAGKAVAKAQPEGFHIGKSGQGIRMVGNFKGTVTLPEVLKSAEESFQKWQSCKDTSSPRDSKNHASKPAKKTIKDYADEIKAVGLGLTSQSSSPRIVSGDPGPKEVDSRLQSSGMTDHGGNQPPKPDTGWKTVVPGNVGTPGGSINDLILDRQKTMLGQIRQLAQNPMTKPIAEQMAKASGCQTVQEFIAKMEKQFGGSKEQDKDKPGEKK